MPPRRSFLLLQKPYIQAIANVTGLDLGGKRTEVSERLSVNEPLIEALVLWGPLGVEQRQRAPADRKQPARLPSRNKPGAPILPELP
jgi:hypothetical protein